MIKVNTHQALGIEVCLINLLFLHILRNFVVSRRIQGYNQYSNQTCFLALPHSDEPPKFDDYGWRHAEEALDSLSVGDETIMLSPCR